MSADDERDEVKVLRARVATLERELGIAEPRRGTSGRLIVLFFGATLVLAFGTALFLWTAAKRTVAARNAVPARLTPSRVDTVGQDIAAAVTACLRKAAPEAPTKVTLRVKLAPAGNVGLLDTRVIPTDNELILCVRQTPSHSKIAAGDDRAGDVEITTETGTDPDGSRWVKSAWLARLSAPPRLPPRLPSSMDLAHPLRG